jgi:hypothetical protein
MLGALLSLLSLAAAIGIGMYLGKSKAEKEKFFLKPPVLYIAVGIVVIDAMMTFMKLMRPPGMMGMGGGFY